ncbi:hypothetical protein O0I10_006712 [Lichtheimia ornata]|uniref:Uncharacterized protein n=1 Tax=Lichtheimia ornata TaxID=688661 RepID=A0AAD7V342_9FUNG|nr:uncharacterized protein O0I10_006712 [Lichtheimia ornata]KAJ8657646.1 hypothetical protein O0I10_006712 [Lichtheimia ornata]
MCNSHQLTTTVHNCLEELVPALDTRASSFADCGQLGMSPWRIFCDQGHHASTITSYDKALQRVPAADSRHHHHPFTAKETSYNVANRLIFLTNTLVYAVPEDKNSHGNWIGISNWKASLETREHDQLLEMVPYIKALVLLDAYNFKR